MIHKYNTMEYKIMDMIIDTQTSSPWNHFEILFKLCPSLKEGRSVLNRRAQI